VTPNNVQWTPFNIRKCRGGTYQEGLLSGTRTWCLILPVRNIGTIQQGHVCDRHNSAYEPEWIAAYYNVKNIRNLTVFFSIFQNVGTFGQNSQLVAVSLEQIESIIYIFISFEPNFTQCSQQISYCNSLKPRMHDISCILTETRTIHCWWINLQRIYNIKTHFRYLQYTHDPYFLKVNPES
jgi:hypothetical protein